MAGTVLLSLPVAQAGEPVSPLDALFTSTSAVCVTGLTVVDTGTRFSPFGQAVVLALIQVGGLGLMTFAVFVGVVLGRKVAFTDRMVIQDSMHHTPTAGVRRLVRYVLAFTLAVEAAGAALLWLRFRGQFPAGEAIWQSVFHSVSAFCNAGFGLLPDNLVRYRADLLVNLAITGLIVVGGLGFLVNMELWDRARARLRGGRAPRLTLHARLALVVTAALLGVGTVAFLLLEWDNVLRGLPLGERLLASWFQSVTPRTAGFNTIDYGQVSVGHALLHDLPDVRRRLAGLHRRRDQDHDLRAARGPRGRALARSRPRDPLPPDHPPRGHGPGPPPRPPGLGAGVPRGRAPGLHRDARRPFAVAEPRFLALMFEAVSAFGTVGLSTGITPSLSAPGKLVLAALMFVGRVGPLTLVLAVGPRQERGRFRYAEENVMVG